MRSRAAPGTADRGDYLAALHRLARLDADLARMSEEGADPEAVVEDHHVAERALGPREDDPPSRRRDDLGARLRGDVEASVELAQAGERRDAVAETRGEPAVRGPDRRRRRQAVGLAAD